MEMFSITKKKWTKQEKRRLDEFLLGWARWEVDYVNGFVRSARCHGTTKNADGICDACVAVSKDESLKRSIRRVRPTIISFELTVNAFEQKVAEAALPASEQSRSFHPSPLFPSARQSRRRSVPEYGLPSVTP